MPTINTDFYRRRDRCSVNRICRLDGKRAARSYQAALRERGDYNKIWLDKFQDFNSSKIYGLIYQGKSAGIVVSKDDRPFALLQNDPKSIFAVYVGDEKIPGIAHGNKNGILIKFIPQWLHPKEGDEVYTSGLDGIFFSGISVGKVTKVIEESLYKSVEVEPYAKVTIPSYLYVVTKEK